MLIPIRDLNFVAWVGTSVSRLRQVPNMCGHYKNFVGLQPIILVNYCASLRYRHGVYYLSEVKGKQW